MTTFKTKTKAIGLLLFSVLMLPSCSDMDEYYEEPDWIAGSIYEKLAADGQHSLFIRGAERAGYKQILDGKSILTVMAPDDEAMSSYLSANYAGQSIDELPIDEVKKLIGFHILYYSFDKEKLINFRPKDGDAMSQKERDAALDAGLFYKFRTYSQDAPTQENDTALVYHLERYLPIFSYKMFESKYGQNGKKGIDAKANYEYFFPDTRWNGEGGFQVANANVTEYANVAKNGYIYKVDHVLKPLATIYDELKQAGKYTKFLGFYDSFKNYVKDEDLTLKYSQSLGGKDLYQIFFNRNTASALPAIASEWPVTNYQDVESLARRAYSIFAPTDKALDDFFNDYWKEGGYASLDDVSPELVQNILRHSIYDETTAKYTVTSDKVLSMVFPEEIEAGRVRDNEGNLIQFDTDEVPASDRIICSNGVLYGCSVLTPPAKFNSVTGPANQYKKFSTFQYILSQSGMESTLSNNNATFIMLYPDSAQLYDNGKIELIDVNGETQIANNEYPQGMGTKAKSFSTNLVNAHVVQVLDGNSKLPATGTKVYPLLDTSLRLYWYVKNGKITSSIKHNHLLKYDGNTTTEDEVYAEVKALDYRGNEDGWSNGHAYSYGKPQDRADLKNPLFESNFNNEEMIYFLNTMWNKRFDTTTEFYGWINLLNAAGCINSASENMLQFYDASTDDVAAVGDQCLMFVPVTDALEDAILKGNIPGVDKGSATKGSSTFFSDITVSDQKALQFYLRQYFIPMSTAAITNYPYVGWGEDTSAEGIVTLQQVTTTDANGMTSTTTTNMIIYDEGDRLSIAIINPDNGTVSKRVNVTSTYDYFPFVFEDGAAHFIEAVL